MAGATKKEPKSLEDQLLDMTQERNDLKVANDKLEQDCIQKDNAYSGLINEFKFYIDEVKSHIKINTGALETLGRRTKTYNTMFNPPRPPQKR